MTTSSCFCEESLDEKGWMKFQEHRVMNDKTVIPYAACAALCDSFSQKEESKEMGGEKSKKDQVTLSTKIKMMLFLRRNTLKIQHILIVYLDL